VPGAAVHQNVTKCLVPDLDVHRYGHGTGRDYRQTGRDPLRTIAANDGHMVPPLYPDPAQTVSEKPHPPTELAIRPGLYSFLTKGH
jgi:hypothetical protein